MQIVKCSNRLQSIAEYVPIGAKLADIGSDHALLPVYLAQKGKIISAIAGELNDGPFQSALSQVRMMNLQDQIDVRQGDGLAVLTNGEVDTIVIAGMGGSLICSILEQGKDKLEGVKRLILQPNVGEKAVRTWLIEEGWAIVNEQLLYEDGVFYEIIVADRTENAREDNAALLKSFHDECGNEITERLQLEMGPYLLRQKEPLLIDKWTDELRKLDRIIENMSHSTSAEATRKREQFTSLYRQIKEVITCLQKDKPSFK